MAVRRLLKTWAMPPASLPMASMFWARAGSSSLGRSSRRVSASRAAPLASSGLKSSTALTAGLLLLGVRIGSLFFGSALRWSGLRNDRVPRARRSVPERYAGFSPGARDQEEAPSRGSAAPAAAQRRSRAIERVVSLRMLEHL